MSREKLFLLLMAEPCWLPPVSLCPTARCLLLPGPTPRSHGLWMLVSSSEQIRASQRPGTLLPAEVGGKQQEEDGQQQRQQQPGQQGLGRASIRRAWGRTGSPW